MTARLRIRDAGGTLRTIDGTGSSRIRMRDAGGTLRTINRIRMRGPDGVLRVVYDVAGTSSFTVTSNFSSRFGSGNGHATTNSVTVTATGGTAPYSYAWTLISHTNATLPTASAPTAATTVFTQTNIASDDDDHAVFRCTVTDSASNTGHVDIGCVFLDTSTL